MNEEFFVKVYNTISKTIWSLLFVITIISGYIIQRSFEINSNIQDKIINLDEPSQQEPISLGEVIGIQLRQAQTESLGLKINYGTLTLLWPIILVSVFLVIHYALKKRIEVINELTLQFSDFKLSNLRLDLFSLSFSKKREQNFFIFLFFILLPITALAFHSYSGWRIIDIIRSSVNNHLEIVNESSKELVDKLVLLFYAQIAVSLTCILFIFIINVRSYRIFKTSASMVLPKAWLDNTNEANGSN